MDPCPLSDPYELPRAYSIYTDRMVLRGGAAICILFFCVLLLYHVVSYYSIR